MIFGLRRKFIFISTVSVFSVIAIVFTLITLINVFTMNKNLDILADSISEGGGKFPDKFNDQQPPKQENGHGRPNFNFITPETPFATRHFTVWFDNDGALSNINTDFIHSVNHEDAEKMGREVLLDNDERGWISNYRYRVFYTEDGRGVVFIDGNVSRSSLWQSVSISAFVLLFSAILVLLLIILLSKRMMSPIAKSYEKQKQFITDANHELKTPLTLILANLDIAESELGKNEWLDDIRSEGHRMTALVNQLVALSRMDEERTSLNCSKINVSDISSEISSDFENLAAVRGKRFVQNIESDVYINADEELFRRLISILLDNAVKYCDDGGEIALTLKKHRSTVITVENTYRAVNDADIDKFFDRFYRADKARTYVGSFGIGLSIAKAIAESHKWEISVYKKDNSHIGFKIVLKT